MGIRHVYQINMQCNTVKVILTLFSCSSDFALCFEDFFIDLCLNEVVCAVCLFKQLLNKEGQASDMFITSTFSVIRSRTL